jgi:hypothetical protein
MTKSHCTVFRFASLLFLCFNLLVAGAQTPIMRGGMIRLRRNQRKIQKQSHFH